MLVWPLRSLAALRLLLYIGILPAALFPSAQAQPDSTRWSPFRPVEEFEPFERPAASGERRVSPRRSASPSSTRSSGTPRRGRLDRVRLPAGALATVSEINVRDADLRDVLRGLGAEYGLNLSVDNAIDRRVTLRLSDLPVVDIIEFLANEYDLVLDQNGPVVGVSPWIPPPSPPTEAPDPIVLYDDEGRLTLDLAGADVRRLARAVSTATGHNVIVRDGVTGPTRGYLRRAPFESGLRAVLSSNGFSLHQRDGIYEIGRPGGNAGTSQGGFYLHVDPDGYVDLDADATPTDAVLRELVAQSGIDIAALQPPTGTVTAQASGLSVDQALDLILRGTDVTYRFDNGVFYVDARGQPGTTTARLLSLKHLRAERALELVPQEVMGGLSLTAVSEHNAVMVVGPVDQIHAVEAVLEAIDRPTPVIHIEALVVEYLVDDILDLGVEFGRDTEAARVESERSDRYEFADGVFETTGDGERANGIVGILDPLARLFGARQIGRLPDDFYFRIQALAREGLAHIRSRPQVSTINGETASLSIGTTQYYLLTDSVPLVSGDQIIVTESQRFEQVEASVKLEITPWVGESGQVTTRIRPEFSTPVGAFTDGVPPTISSRILESTVRLADGETIILGGLIESTDRVVYSKVPVLGSIPLIGRLFSSRRTEMTESELVIYLTPHVFYGDDRDADRWRDVSESMGLRDSPLDDDSVDVAPPGWHRPEDEAPDLP